MDSSSVVAMTKRARLFLLICSLLFLVAPGWAQTDPEALEHAWAFKQKFDQDDKPGFRALLKSDVELGRRAYLAALEYALQNLHKHRDKEGEEGFLAAALIAEGLARLASDQEPRRILKAFQEEDPKAVAAFLTYADRYRPGYREGLKEVLAWLQAGIPNVEEVPPRTVEADYNRSRLNTDTMSAEYRELLHPYLAKLQRIHLAETFADPTLTMQELDGQDQAFQTLQNQAEAMSDETLARVNSDFAYVQPKMAAARLRILAEVGLVDEFNTKLNDLLRTSNDTNSNLDLLYTGFRMASRQGLFDQAEGYLHQMENTLRLSGDQSSPVFPFVVKTGRVQLAWGRGQTFTASELTSSFEDAWSELSSFRPIQRVEDDTSWHLIRSGAHFWVDRLAELKPSENVDSILRLTQDCSTWVNGIDAFQSTLNSMSDDQSLFYSEQLQGYLTVALSSLDTLIYVVEKWKPMLNDRENFAGVAYSFPKSLEGIRQSASEISAALDAFGYPHLPLEDSFLLTELQARSLYLIALDPNHSDAERVGKLQEAAERFERISVPESYIDYHILLGHQFHNLEQSDLAIEAWQNAYEMAVERSFVERSIDAATLLSREFGASGRWERAQALASAASQGIQDQLGASETRSSQKLARLNQDLAELQARAAVKSEKPELALMAITRNQQLQSANVRLRGNEEAAKATHKLQTKKRQLAVLSRKVKELEKLPSSATRNELLEKAQKLLAESKSEFLLQSREIRKRFSKLYSTALRFDPLNLPDIQQSLPPKTAVVQYFPTQDELFVFVVAGDRFRLRSVSQKKSELDSLVMSYLGEMKRQAPLSGNMGERSRRLYGTLLAPVEDDLQGLDTLVLIPSGKLNLLPFGSLMDSNGKFLIEKKVILELAKPTDFLKIALTSPKPVGKLVAFANATGDLPAAEAEGQHIVELFPEARLFKGSQASRQNLMQFGSQADVLHLATHGVWDTENSLKNHLKLANKEELGQEEIFDLQLGQTSLVTLSACNTALGELKDVEYVASLAEAFWIAGSRSVVASLWAVEDRSTQTLMTSFYQELKEGTPKGQALRQAQLAVKNQSEFEHPYYWSGFLLFGDYR